MHLFQVDNTGATGTGSRSLPASPITSVALRAGTYKTSVCINVPSGGSLYGAGVGPTIIISTSTTAGVVCPASGGANILIADLEPDAIGDAYQLRPWHPDGDRRTFSVTQHHPQCALAK